MRIWHYELIPFLPTKQLQGQWRELNSIFKKQDNHILINYVYCYPKENLLYYSVLVVNEMNHRGFKTKMENFLEYFNGDAFDKAVNFNDGDNPFPRHHNKRYLLQCFYNLQEKFDRGQKDFLKDKYEAMENFVLEKE